MPNHEPLSKDLTEIEQHRRWSAAIVKAIESFKGEGARKLVKAE
jgi:hypothetical protein